ncbi:MAG: tRNA pseudouridine38-40 synthase [Candidatus Saganbacteria bacterium]|uniref:tRNA pseudouridine synthase A n=1 Tax=Candidatus Saganbacteria bacterium TaxID=2575572 RepID=A0A833L192_UNCSA|nr:MAG: tRNA pseudouridine38-40 synthase [Candidatus Saganbacteria bacterium]
MKNVKLVIMYDGTSYFGFAEQKNAKTVMGEIRRSLKKLLGEEVKVNGASRTDRGVHAIGQVVNFKCASRMGAGEFLNALNFYLPKDIRVLDSEEIDDSFHARFSAKNKEYCYSVFEGKEIPYFLRSFALHVKRKLDVPLMKLAAGKLTGEHDFSSFAQEIKGSPVRVIESIEIEEKPQFVGRLLELKFKGNGFLYKMVRALSGTLVDAGLKKIKPNDVAEILEARDRKRAGKTLPGHGLCLVKVNY